MLIFLSKSENAIMTKGKIYFMRVHVLAITNIKTLLENNTTFNSSYGSDWSIKNEVRAFVMFNLVSMGENSTTSDTLPYAAVPF